jgi:hypothetical protein
MGVQLAEAQGEVALLGGAEILVLEEQHLVVEQGLAHVANRRVRVVVGEVDAGDHRADRRGQRRHGELVAAAHARLLVSFPTRV